MAQFDYEPSAENPFGLPNPEAPPEIKDYQSLIGICDCISTRRKPDGSWAAPNNMSWEFKYIMNGMAVQDQTLKEDGLHAGSIRQYIADKGNWYVHYYSSSAPTTQLGAWEGGKVGEEMILYRDQKAPNGMEGKYKITFYDISDAGFKWKGEWVSPDESIVYPTWNIECTKRN